MSIESRIERLERDARPMHGCTCHKPRIRYVAPDAVPVDERCDYCRRSGRVWCIIDVSPSEAQIEGEVMNINNRINKLEQSLSHGSTCAGCGVTVTVNAESPGACNRKVLERCELCGRVTLFSFAILHDNEDDRLAA